MIKPRSLRLILSSAIAIGMILMVIGPLARLRNEGFGDSPGPVQVSKKWQQVSYILMPTGAAISIISATALFVIDRNKP